MARRRLFVESSVLVGGMSGVGHVLASTLEAWAKNREAQATYETILVAPWGCRKEIEAFGFGFKVVTLPVPYNLYRLLRKYNAFGPVDILLGKGIYLFPDYWNWPLVRSKSITYIHDLYFMKRPEAIAPKNRKFLTSHITSWSRRANVLVAVSDFTKREIIEARLATPDKITVVHNGVGRRRSYVESEVRSLLEEIGVTEDYLLYVGNIEPRKNIERLIAAYERLPARLKKQYSLILAGGDGWMSDSIDTAIASAQGKGLKIIRPRRLSDTEVGILYDSASALVHPALYEGFGITPLEAMVYGLPTLVSNVASLPEVVGDASLLVDPLNIEDISDKIELLLTDSKMRARLSAAGYEQIKKFSWEKSAEDLRRSLDRIKL